ncbi:exopolysaccharide Pel transporter PelG [Neobacillus dielmonensis]|uniref:exopolysaccharide Pel transporter PelG n=1 Tax=Neobacillus dielmonensis TaxID=1347369 RepID=UPI0005A6E0B0|nr:exopolysaccharide Pel transporter PelG [Neobacillus dielmonensis]
MAGIGFQLKHLFKDNSFLGKIRAFTFSSIVIAGPMVLCITLMTLSEYVLELMDTPYYEKEMFLGGTLYSFVFSQLLTGGFTMLLSRYLADQIYQEQQDNILSSLYGILAINLMLGGAAGIIFYSFSPLPIFFKIFSYVFYIELIIIWLLSIYISAIKKYLQIIVGFSVGAAISSLLILLGFTWLGINSSTGIFICLDIGFFVIVMYFFKSIKEHFPKNNLRYFDFLTYLEKYPSLFLVGLFYSLGLYGHSFIVWGGDLKTIISSTFVMAPIYDTPVFYAYLTILPAIVMFVVAVETSFYDEYKNYYSLILGQSSLNDIKDAQAKMFSILSREFAWIMEFQLFFTICSIAIGTKLLPLSTDQVDIFNIITVGNYFFIMMFIIIQILLYFDDRKGAAFVITSYCLANILLTIITSKIETYGLSCFLAGFIGLVLALKRISYYSKNFNYYTFCSLPIMVKQEKLFITKVVQKLNLLNGVGGSYETKE